MAWACLDLLVSRCDRHGDCSIGGRDHLHRGNDVTEDATCN